MEKTGKIPGVIRHNWDHQQPCILSKAVPPELLEVVYSSRRSLWREAISTLSCTEQRASHEYYQLSTSGGVWAASNRQWLSKNASSLFIPLDMQSGYVPFSALLFPSEGGTCQQRGLSPHGEWRGRSKRFLALCRREGFVWASPVWAGGADGSGE